MRPTPTLVQAPAPPRPVAAGPRATRRRPRLARRRMLLLGGGLVLAVAGGALYRAADQGVFASGRGPAFEPWRAWRPDGAGQPEALVGAAVLAASGHNVQPWRFRLGADYLNLLGDPGRRTGAMDPADRELWVGLGCALENLVLAARAAGYSGDAALFPEAADPWLAARVSLAPGAATRSELYTAIPQRRTNRGPYEPARPVGADVLGALAALVDDPAVEVRWLVGEPERRRFGDLTVEAVEAFVADRAQSEAAFAWYRATWQDVHRFRDGLNLDSQALPAPMTLLGKLLPTTSREQGDGYWLQSTRDVHVATAAAFGLLLVRRSDPPHWVRAGRAWQRLHLWATTQGLAVQPLDQIPIRAEREAELGLEPRFGRAQAELIGDEAWSAALAFRVGYPTVRVPPSPRRPVDAVLQAGPAGAVR